MITPVTTAAGSIFAVVAAGTGDEVGDSVGGAVVVVASAVGVVAAGAGVQVGGVAEPAADAVPAVGW